MLRRPHATMPPMLRYATLPVTAFQQNCSLVWCDETTDAAVIDPGGDAGMLLEAIEQRGLTLKALWLTHAHIDHAGATAPMSFAMPTQHVPLPDHPRHRLCPELFHRLAR